MRSTELHGERRSWNHHLVRRVVRSRQIFLEVWILRDVGDDFQDFVTHSLAASAAIRKNAVTHQDHAGARLVLVADFIYPGLLHQLSRSQYTVGLVKSCSVSWCHASLCWVPSWAAAARAMLESKSALADVMHSE